MDLISSDSENDSKFPNSIRSRLKRIFKEALCAEDDEGADEVSHRFEQMRIEDSVNETIKKMGELRVTNSSFRCKTCSHEFSQRKTLNMHMKACLTRENLRCKIYEDNYKQNHPTRNKECR